MAPLSKKTKTIIIATVGGLVGTYILYLLVVVLFFGAGRSSNDTNDIDIDQITTLSLSSSVNTLEQDALVAVGNPTKLKTRKIKLIFSANESLPYHKLNIVAANSANITDIECKRGIDETGTVESVTFQKNSRQLSTYYITNNSSGGFFNRGQFQLIITFTNVPTSFKVNFELAETNFIKTAYYASQTSQKCGALVKTDPLDNSNRILSADGGSATGGVSSVSWPSKDGDIEFQTYDNPIDTFACNCTDKLMKVNLNGDPMNGPPVPPGFCSTAGNVIGDKTEYTFLGTNFDKTAFYTPGKCGNRVKLNQQDQYVRNLSADGSTSTGGLTANESATVSWPSKNGDIEYNMTYSDYAYACNCTFKLMRVKVNNISDGTVQPGFCRYAGDNIGDKIEYTFDVELPISGVVPPDEFKVYILLDKVLNTITSSGSINGQFVVQGAPTGSFAIELFQPSKELNQYVTNFSKLFTGSVTYTVFNQDFVYDGTQSKYDQNIAAITQFNNAIATENKILVSLAGKLLPSITDTAKFVAARDSVA